MTDAARRPKAALLMIPGLESQLLPEALMDRLCDVVELVSPVPIADPRATSVRAGLLDDVEVALCGWGCPPIDHRALEAMESLRMVAHGAGSVRGIVTDELWERNITVTSAAAANAIPVAEFTFAAIVMINKDVFGIRDRHREARGTKQVVDFAVMGNRGRRIGLVGASSIGRLVAERLETIDVEVSISDPFLSEEEAAGLGVSKVELDVLLQTSDVVSLHAPALASTRHMIAAPELALMKDGGWLINTARGSLIEPGALQAELSTGRINALIDTSDPEPLPAESPLYDLPNVVLTPHIAGSLGTEISRMGEMAVSEIERFTSNQPPLNPVTRADMNRIA